MMNRKYPLFNFDFNRFRLRLFRFWKSYLQNAVLVRSADLLALNVCRKKNRTGKGSMTSLDVSETKNDLVVKAEVPGMDAKDIDISLSDGVLTIKGEKKQEKEEKEDDYHLVERSYGAFVRSVRLPREVLDDKVNASYKDGVLKITLPKSEEAKKKEIKIKVE